MTYNNFSISASKGKLYLKSKEPKEGYEKVTYGTNGENTTYHQYHNNIKGTPSSLETKEIIHEGRTLRFLEFSLTEGDTLNKVSVPLKNKGGYTDEVKALISALNGLELGEEVTLSPVKNKYTNKKGEDKEQLAIYINYVNRFGENGKGLSTGFIPYSDIPAPTSKVVAGDTTWDFSPQTEFYWEKLTELEARFKGQSTPSAASTPAKPEPKAETPKNELPKPSASEAFEPATNYTPEPHDDLPFA